MSMKCRIFVVLFLIVFAPFFVEAKVVKKKPVKKAATVAAASIDPKKAPTRCLGKSIRSMYDVSVRQMEKDIAKAGNGYGAATKRYRDNLQLVWAAMNEPYCGYGSRGVNAVKHSFNKTIVRTRSEFLQAVKVKASASR